ncbi:hypothetical protein chiPu_0022075 [Chiloscyllium punctatum]|uniref:Uncharacterized protein n=1 Tax=Chiloscyllium punctatum TaxID=137246 RepID=A0A401RJG9_CHIPU|nr:hypothetical protein [Chiloscyllium punctatum]
MLGGTTCAEQGGPSEKPRSVPPPPPPQPLRQRGGRRGGGVDAPPRPRGHYLTEVAGDPNVVPAVVVELAVDGLHQSLEGPRAQVDDQRNGAVLQRQVDVVGRLARVQDEPVALQGPEREGDLVAAALDGVVREVVAEELGALEGGYGLFLRCRGVGGVGEKDRPLDSWHTPGRKGGAGEAQWGSGCPDPGSRSNTSLLCPAFPALHLSHSACQSLLPLRVKAAGLYRVE